MLGSMLISRSTDLLAEEGRELMEMQFAISESEGGVFWGYLGCYQLEDCGEEV